MASTSPPKAYRLQGIPSKVTSNEEVAKLLRRGRDGLANYDVQVYSLAMRVSPHPSKVAGIMFSLRPQEEKPDETTPQPSGDEFNQNDGNTGAEKRKRKKKKRRGEASSQPSRASTFRDLAAPDPGPGQPADSAPGRPDHFIEIVAQVKDGLILDDNFFGMTPLVDLGLDDHEFDCIAISGIGSHAFGSWQQSGGDKQFMWIRDAFRRHFPFARPILYGYDTKLHDAYSFQRVLDIALTLVNHLRVLFDSSLTKRPLVFVTHSLGGIVLKEAMVCLSRSRQSRDIKLLENIWGAIFFGVPNHGMVIDHLIALASGSPNQYLIEDLKQGSGYLARLEDSFSSFTRGKSFFWGYETKESIIPIRNAKGTWTKKDPKCPRLKLVERESATRGLWKSPEEAHLVFQIDEDHSSMVKFASMEDPNLAIVVNILSQIFVRPLPEDIQGIDRQPDLLAQPNLPRRSTLGFPSEKLLRRSTSGFPVEEDTASQENMDLSGNRIQNFKLLSESANFPTLEPFFGRGSELKSLENHLDRGSTSSQRIVSVHGPPGIGKTHLITQYISAHRGYYDNIFCLEGATTERFRLTLRRETNRIRQSWSDLLFQAFKLADTHFGNIERFCTFLNSDGNDNWLLVIDELRQASTIFERLKQGTIILVSSSSQPATKYPAVKLGPLERGAEHHKLLSALDYHPSLIRLAVPKMLGFKSISYFLQNWNNGDIKLTTQTITRVRGILEAEFYGALPTFPKGLLEFCLLINHKAISYEFLEFLGILQPKDLELFFSDTIERLARHGLLETRLPREQTVTFSISAILYQCLRQTIDNWLDNLMNGTRILAQKIPRSSKDNHRASLEILEPHAELLAKYIINNPKTANPSADYLDNMERIASLLRLVGYDGDAIKLYGYIHQQNKDRRTGPGKVASLSRSLHNNFKLSFTRTAELYNNMGLSCLNEGDVTFAFSCFGKAMATLNSTNLGNTNTMLEVVANVARAHLDVEDYAAAERLLVDKLSKFEKKGQDSLLPLQLLPLQHFLGFARFKLGQTEQGIRNLEVSCETALKNPRAGKRLAYSIMHDLATSYCEQKQFTKSTGLYEKAREGRMNVHGPEHRYTIETTAALALSYHGSGQNDKAAACFQKALKWRREHLRPNHPDTLQTLQNYGIFQSDVGNLEAAKKALRLAHTGLTQRDDKLGRVSWKRINAGVSLALVLQGLKSFYDSAGLFEEAVSWYKGHCPLFVTDESSVETSKTVYQYCKTLYLQGRMYEDWGYLTEAFKRYTEADQVSAIAGCEIDYWRQLSKKRIDELKACAGLPGAV